MKKISILAMSAAAVLSCAPKGDPQLGKDSLDKVIAAMTLEEKAHLVIGTGMAGSSGEAPVVGETRNLVPGAAGTTYPIPRLGIPAIVLADGPAGLRINPLREGDANTYYCTHFPIGTLLASTWNTELVEQVGQAIGNEVLEYGTDVLLAPALNIHRNPLCGRNFEYYSEDPVVSGKTAAAYVRGVQSNGVGTSIKHYALNNQETNRMKNDVRVSPRAVREIYLKGFEIAVKESQPWTVMSSYNFVNGVYTSESKDLQTTMLRDEWGFKGMVMTDWFGGADAAAQMWAGNDMLQPGRPGQFEDIVEGVRSGRLSEADLDRNVRRVLELIVKSPRFKGYEFSNKPDLKAHAAVTRQSAVEGMVLLENNGVLPLASEISRVALFGTTSYDFIAGGTGSGNVNRAYTVSLLEGLRNAGYAIDAELEKTYTKYIKEETERLNPKSDDPMAMFMPKIRAGEFVPSARLLDKMVRANDVAIITLGRNSGEFLDRKVADFTLTEQESGMIEAVCAAFHKAGVSGCPCRGGEEKKRLKEPDWQPRIGELRGRAIGLMHMTPEAFGAMRIGAYWEAWWAYTEEKNADRRHVGELARGMAIRLFNIQLDKKDRIRKLRDFWGMPWDEESEEDAIVEKLNALSDEERDQKAREFMNKLGWRK